MALVFNINIQKLLLVLEQLAKNLCSGRLDRCASSELNLRKVRFTNPQMDEIN